MIYVLSIVVCIPSTFCPTLGRMSIMFNIYIYIYIYVCVREREGERERESEREKVGIENKLTCFAIEVEELD